MHRAGLVPVATFLLAGCGAAGPRAVPPVIEIPVPPAAPSSRPATVAAPGLPAPPTPAPVAPWVERAVRTEATKPVGGHRRCQIAPFSFASTIAVESRLVDGGKLALRVVQDDEVAKGITAPPTLLGKGYVVDAAGAVQGTDGASVPDDPVARVRALAASFLGWPGADLAAHVPAAGAEVPGLEAPVAAVADVPLHGTESAQRTSTVVRFSGVHPADAGEEQVFDVTLKVSAEDAGMCHHWTSEADLKGELRLRASNGALLGLHLEGTTHDTEGLCQDPSGKPGSPPPPHLCNEGKVSIDVRQPRVP